jgi:hypothetical protein
MKEFDHIGIWTDRPQPGEGWVESSKCWVTNPRLHPARIEYLRAQSKPDVPKSNLGLWKLWNLPHVAYRVDDLASAIQGEEVILGPFEPADFGPIAFIHKDGAVIEYLQYTDESVWFGAKTPWRPAGE